MKTLHETCLEYFRRRLSEDWKCVSLEGHNAVLLSPEGFRRELDLRNDIETFRPNGVGSETNIDDEYPDGVAHWSLVDDIVPDDDDTYVVNMTTDFPLPPERDLYALPAHAAEGTINKVTVYMRTYTGSAFRYLGRVKTAIYTHTTVYEGDEEHPVVEYTLFSTEYITNPNTGVAWTWDEIDALEAGVTLCGTGWGSRCTQVYVEVDYTFVPPAPPVAPEYQRRVLMQKQPDGSYKEVSANYPFEVHDPKALFSMDFWSDPQEEVQLTDTAAPGTDVALPDVTVADLPTGATIVRAIAMFKFRMVENTNAAANKLQGAQHIQVRDDTPGTWRDAISLVADQFGVAATTREGGDVLIGDHDIAIEVDGNDTYNFQWAASLVDQANLQFNDIQVGLRIWYEG